MSEFVILFGSANKVKYRLRDEFTTSRFAGQVNGTLAEPGAGVRTVVDASATLSLAGGNLVMAPGSAASYGLYLNGVTRAKGVMVVGSVNFTTRSFSAFGFASTLKHYPNASSLFVNGPSIFFYDNGAGPALANFAASTFYPWAVVLRGTGAYYFLKVSEVWVLLYSAVADLSATLYPAIGNDGAGNFVSNFLRVPLATWLPIPLLSDGFGGTWPTADGQGHAEGVAGGIGAGGGGLIWLDMGNCSLAAGLLTITPVTNPSIWDAAAAIFTSGTYSWVPNGTNTIANVGNALQITYVNNTYGANCYFSNAADLSQDLVVGVWYKYSVNSFINVGDYDVRLNDGVDFLDTTLFTNTSPITAYLTFRAKHTTNCYAQLGQLGSGEVVTLDNIALQKLPISSLVTNTQLTTSNMLAEATIHAYTTGTQAGIIQADRSFQGLANAGAAAGQPVIILKNLTAAVQVAGASEDTITIKHPIAGATTYTIASVGTLSGGVQTITLDSNLVEAVLADDKIGVDYALWNGTLTYFDGLGNLKLDEVKAGVYTNRGSTTKAFVVDAKLVVRKIGDEYRLFYNNTLVGTAITTVDAEAMVGTYFGLFSTWNLNTFTSLATYATGAEGQYANLDRY
jgi:hypothetical protein